LLADERCYFPATWPARRKGKEFRSGLLDPEHLPATAWQPDVVVDLVSARGRRGAVIFHLGHLGHRSWCPDGIDAPQGLNLAEKVLVAYMLEAKLCVVSRNPIDRRRAAIEKHRYHKHAVVTVADSETTVYLRRYTTNAVRPCGEGFTPGHKVERDIYREFVYVLGTGTYAEPKQASQSKYNGKD